jgi:hypothetical protein
LLKRPQLRSRCSRNGVPETVEPGARIEILFAVIQLDDHGTMGVPHDDEPQRGLLGQKTFGPVTLTLGCPCERGFILGVITQGGTHKVHQPKPQVRMKKAVDGRGSWMLDEPMDELRLPSGFRQSVSVDRDDGPVSDLERGAERMEPKT